MKKQIIGFVGLVFIILFYLFGYKISFAIGWERHCEGWWHTFTYNGKIYHCLPQIDHGKMYKGDIYYYGKKYTCHVNSEDITKEKIKKSCQWNKEVIECFAGTFAIPKRMKKQEGNNGYVHVRN